MGCIILIAPTITMATTQLIREARGETCRVQAATSNISAPRMNWVVVTDQNQTLQMQVHWTPSGGDR